VPGEQHALAAGHPRPPLAGAFDGAGLADELAVVGEHRVAADDHRVGVVVGDRPGLGLGERGDDVLRVGVGPERGGDRVLVHTGHLDDGVDAGRAEDAEAGGGLRGEDELHGRTLGHV